MEDREEKELVLMLDTSLRVTDSEELAEIARKHFEGYVQLLASHAFGGLSSFLFWDSSPSPKLFPESYTQEVESIWRSKHTEKRNKEQEEKKTPAPQLLSQEVASRLAAAINIADLVAIQVRHAKKTQGQFKDKNRAYRGVL
jgi:hypothetical protein